MRFRKIPFKKILFVLLIIAYSVELAQAVTVSSADGSGDDKQINAALREVDQAGGGTVTLKGSFVLRDSLEVGSNTILEGDGATLKLKDKAVWEAWKPLIKITGKENVIIRNLEIDGNSDNNQDVGKKTHNGKAWGNGFYNFIGAVNCGNLEVSGVYMHDGLGDGLRATNCINVLFHDNEVYKLGHDAFFFIRSEGAEAFNNKVTPRTNSAFRLWDSSHVRIYDNVITGFNHWSAGGPGIQIEDTKGEMEDIEVCNNQLYNCYSTGLWLIAYDKGASNSQNINVHHNLISGSGPAEHIPYNAGITIYGVKGTIIKNNVFDGSYNAGVLVLSGGSGTTIKDNIITNTVKHTNGKSSGYGINNNVGASLDISDNCFFNNVNGDLVKCTSSGDDLQDPKKHITSSGWTWTGSTWTCDGVKPSPMDSIINHVKPGEDPRDEPDRNLESIFDILELEFSTSGRTGQTAEDIPVTVEEHTSGIIAGGLKIVGFGDMIYIDDVPYIPDEKSVLVKYKVIQSPDLIGWTGRIKQIDKDLDIKIENGTASAVLTVKTSWYTVKNDPVTGKSKKSKIKTSTAVFQDSCPAPEILERPTEAKGILYEYPIYSLAHVPSVGLTAVEYEYDGKKAKHIYMIGERHKNENGAIYTNFSTVNYWKGELDHQGEFLFINGSFDPEKLTVTAYTPYEAFQVVHFDHIKKDYPEKFYADWLFPSFGLFLILGFGAWYYIRKILY